MDTAAQRYRIDGSSILMRTPDDLSIAGNGTRWRASILG
jgi:hypothetical protein